MGYITRFSLSIAASIVGVYLAIILASIWMIR